MRKSSWFYFDPSSNLAHNDEDERNGTLIGPAAAAVQCAIMHVRKEEGTARMRPKLLKFWGSTL